MAANRNQGGQDTVDFLHVNDFNYTSFLRQKGKDAGRFSETAPVIRNQYVSRNVSRTYR